MGLLDKLTAPFKGIADWQKQQAAASAGRAAAENAAVQSRRSTHLQEIMEEFADAIRIEPKAYRELSAGEAKMGKTPAVEYFQNTTSVRLHNLMSQDMMRMAALIDVQGMRLDTLEEGEVGELVDVKPRDMVAIEYGAVNLGPVEEFKGALGSRWRFFVELSYSAASSSGRGGIQTRRYIADCTLT